LDQLNLGQPDTVALEGIGRFDRVASVGKLELHSTAASFGQITALVTPFAPSLAARLNAMGTSRGPARVNLAFEINKSSGQADRGNARAVIDVDAPQLKGITTITAKPPLAAMQSIDLQALGRSELGIESKLSSEQGRSLLALLGLDRTIAAGDGPAQFEGSATGAWGSSLRLKAKISGKGLDGDVDGTAEPWAQEPKAGVSLKIRSADFGPLLDLKPSDTLAQNVGLSSRVSLAGNKLAFDDLDSTIAGSRLRGHFAVTLGEEKNIEGEIGLDQLALAPAFALAMGAAGHDASEPLTAGLVKGWRGKVAFQALRGALPGGSELQPVSGVVKSDGQSLTFDAIKGKIGGGDATATIDARPGANGIALNASIQLSGVDGSALRYRNLAMPSGRASMQVTLASVGRSASALTGALSGSGTVTLESARIAGLDPRAFEAAVRASDGGQAKDDARLRQIVEPALLAGALTVGSAQIPFNIRDGRLRVGATTLDANGVRATVSGGYDIPADQADIRAALALTMVGPATGRPEIQLFAVGTPDALNRSVDVTGLSSWLAVRTIDHETRRLDAIERGEPPPPALAPISLPPPVDAQPLAPEVAAPGEPLTQVPIPGRDPRRASPPKPKAVTPRPAPAPPPAATAPAPAPNPPAPVANQQVAPLPPPIEVRPAPGPAPVAKPRPKPPLSLTPQVANPPPPRPALQNN
ncbi:MAG: AsmA-like C-terminal region-containing protein, partial [Bradyrhizobium sp.]